MNEPITAVFFGVSGAGKGTQVGLLKGVLERNSDLGVLSVEMGERLRGFAAAGGNAGKRVGEIINAGALVPEFLPSHIITSFLINEFHGTEHLLFDGMRRVEQVRVLDESLIFFGREDYHVVVLDLPEEEALRRMLERGRNDDSEEKARRRMEWYAKETAPAIQELEKRGRTIHRIDACPSIEDIHKQILSVFKLA